MKKILKKKVKEALPLLITFLVLIIAVSVIINRDHLISKKSLAKIPPENKVVSYEPVTAENAAYSVNGENITLVNGQAEKEIAPGSTSKEITKYFGNRAVGDLNGDGAQDVSFLITQDNGGSGIFYYVVAALFTENGYQGTNAILLGDRIAPQSTEIKDGQITVNYADRKADESFAVSPSVGVSKTFKVIDNKLVATN